MRVLTANLYTGRAIVSSFESVIDREQPDVVVCQELGTNVAGMLERRFAHGVVVGDDVDHAGRAMVSEHPIDVVEVEMAHRPGLSARLDVKGAGVELVGVHLANPVMGIGAVRDRKRQVEAVLDHVDRRGTPAVVVGDMNATPAWPAYRRLRTRLLDGVSDARKQIGSGIERTWSVRPGWPALLRIDHILTAGVRLEDVAVHRVEGSDHRAVAATIRPIFP
jgi:endonuclease/exonuclease/phosphatase family metal-dependent hydrolase